MAQLVERTLGKGEVPSSTLGISTTLNKPRFGGVFVFTLTTPEINMVYYAITSEVRCRVS